MRDLNMDAMFQTEARQNERQAPRRNHNLGRSIVPPLVGIATVGLIVGALSMGYGFVALLVPFAIFAILRFVYR